MGDSSVAIAIALIFIIVGVGAFGYLWTTGALEGLGTGSLLRSTTDIESATIEKTKVDKITKCPICSPCEIGTALPVSGISGNLVPIPDFIATESSGNTVTYDGSPSTDSDGTIVSYGWDFGDGTSYIQSVNHTYATPGDYEVTLIAVDDKGGVNSITETISVCGDNSKETGTIFMTSTRHYGNFGGITSGDEICQVRADAAGFGCGTWIALLSDSTTDAIDRLPNIVYKRMDGTIIANSKTDLFDGNIQNPIVFDEYGNEYATGKAWTGTWGIGRRISSAGEPANTCNDWTSVASGGQPDEIGGQTGHCQYTTGGWVSISTGAPCDDQRRLYCVKIAE